MHIYDAKDVPDSYSEGHRLYRRGDLAARGEA